MNKSMRKANERLAKAIEYVNNFYNKNCNSTHNARMTEPCNITPPKKKATNSDVLLAITKTEIKKIDKGNFMVVVTWGGQEHVLDKKFKSTTKAQEWIIKHPYI